LPKKKDIANQLHKPSVKPVSKLHNRAEEALKESISLLQATLESTADGILVVDKSGKITSYNRQFADMWRIPDDVVASRDDDRALNHVLEQLKDPESFISKVRELYAHPDESSFDVLEFKDGKIYERYSQAQRVDSNPIGRVWSFRDVTLRKKAEQGIRLLAQAIASTQDCVSLTDLDEKIIFVNEAFLQTYGYTREELIGQPVSIFRTVKTSRELGSQILTATFAGGWSGELFNLRKDGKEFPIELWTSVVKDDRGTVIAMVGVARDITQRKRDEETLRESEERNRQLIETMQDGIYRSSHEGKFLEVNPAMVKILGYANKEELLAIDIKKQLYFDAGDRESAALEKNLEEIAVFRLRRKDGSEVWVEDHGRHVVDEDGNVLYHEGVLRDVTERKLAEDALRKSTGEREELIQELQFALDNVKTLQGLIPICANCKKIRDDKGYWNQVEGYIMEHSDATFTHGVCPECAKKLFEEP
jgi:PAS domain S-box-containing protein